MCCPLVTSGLVGILTPAAHLYIFVFICLDDGVCDLHIDAWMMGEGMA